MRAVITGGSSGIGLATARCLGKAGYEIFILSRNPALKESTVAALQAEGIQASYYPCDVTDEVQVNAVFSTIAKQVDGVDVLVNAVGGLGGRHEVTDMPTEFMRKVMALNFDSVFFVTRACLPLLKQAAAQKGDAAVINFSTIAVTSGGGPGASIYSASKGAVESYTRGLAKDLIQFGIRVNAVSPGTIDTPFHAATDPKLVQSWVAGIPMGRLGKAEEVASVVKFLASPDASYLLGEVVQINGGQAFL